MPTAGKVCAIVVGAFAWVLLACGLHFALAQAPTKAVGTVKSVSGRSLVITTDAGTESTITFADSVRIVKATPGQSDLKNAATIQISDIQAGDRLFARGSTGENGVLIASSAIIMKKSDVAQKQQTERDEWRRGVGGIVKDVKTSTGAITIANSLEVSGQNIIVHVSPQTSIRRYAPDSIRFDDAQPGTLDQLKSGDQLRARGTKNPDGTEFAAQAIVSGTFREIAGTVVSTDPATNSVTVQDFATKKPIFVKVSSDSQVRKLPEVVATRLAMRLKGGQPDSASAQPGTPGQGSEHANASSPADHASQGGQNSGKTWQGGRDANGPGGADNWRGNGPPDFQQMLSRMPALSISDLNKGDAVMLVTTEGSAASEPKVITLISGVEPILRAAPGGAGAAMMLSPWNLGSDTAAAGGDSSTQ